MPREYTREEIREKVIKQIWYMVNYWDKDSRAGTQRRRLEGLAHSILVLFDGEHADIPGFLVIPNPDITDRDFNIREGKDYYPFIMGDESVDQLCDIAGYLHSDFYRLEPRE